MFDTFMRILAQYGIVAVLFVGAIIIIIKYFTNKIGKMSQKDFVQKLDSTNPLRNHPFFSNINYRKNLEIPTLTLDPSKPVRQKMFRDLLFILMKNIEFGCLEIADMENQMEDWQSDKWINVISNKLTDIFNRFILDARADGVPDIVIEKFSTWNQPTVEVLYEYVSNLGNSNIFNSNISRTNTLFFILNLLIVTTIGDAEKTIKSLNGELTGKEFKGSIVEE